jgi:hypothetical protein
MADPVIAVLTRKRVKVIIFTNHTTHIFQMLDVVLFGALKKNATGFRTLDEESIVTAFIIKVYHDFKETMVEINIWGAFSSIGLTHYIDQNPYGLTVLRRGIVPTKSGFLELWERNVRLENLSKRRQQVRFGWINKPG